MDKIEKLKAFLVQDPQDSFLQHALALEYVKLGEDETARKLFEDLLGQNEAYIGSYYHLGKLLERKGERAKAIEWYEKGLSKAKECGDRHAYQELLAAYEDLVD
ncbi:MAG: tetratricopeptide repeat protein [Flavisolibacter sp.]